MSVLVRGGRRGPDMPREAQRGQERNPERPRDPEKPREPHRGPQGPLVASDNISLNIVINII